MKEVVNWGAARLTKGGQVELLVKAGWRVRIQLKSDAYHDFQELSDHPDDSKIEYYETGLAGKSVAKVWLNGGAALAVAAENLELSDSFTTEIPNISDTWEGEGGNSRARGEWGLLGTFMALTPRPDMAMGGNFVADPEGGRQFWFNNEDDDVRVTLLEWDRDPLWESAQENPRSKDSEGIEDYEAEGERAVIDPWIMDRIFDREQDKNGWWYDIEIGTNDDQEFAVFCNGVMVWSGYSRDEAYTEAENLKALIDRDGLPPAYQRERGEEDVPPKSDLPFWVLGGLIVAGVLVGGYFIFRFVDTLAKGSASKVVGE